MKFADLIDNKLTRSNLDKLHKEIFDFDYPFYDVLRKGELERKLLRHYMFYPIGFDDLDTFKFYLENYFQTEVATYYNKLYIAQNGLRPYEAVGIRSSTSINGNTSTTDNTSNNVNVTGKDSNTSNTTTNNTSNSTTNASTDTTSNTTQATTNTQKGGTKSTVTDDTQTHTTNNVEDTEKINTTSHVTGGDTTVYGKKINVNYDYPVNVEALNELAGTNASVEKEHTDRFNKDTSTTDTGTNTKTSDTTTNTRNSGTVTTTNGVTDDYKTSSNVTGNATDNVTGSVTGNTTDKIVSDSTGTNTSTSNTIGRTERTGEMRNNQTITVDTHGLSDSLSTEYIKYKTAIDNIDLMVINGCRDLFMLVWD